MKVRSIHFAASSLVVLSCFAVAAYADDQSKKSNRIARGEYLVRVMGCNDCHTPWKMGKDGPGPDMERMLSGHPQSMAMPVPPKLPEGPWAFVASASMTAWSGPWGVSFTSNLTPDPETGIGKWNERTFVDTMRSGKVLGKGRTLLPPMPWNWYRTMSESDLKAMYAYLMSIPPVKNKVPGPLAPEDLQSKAP